MITEHKGVMSVNQKKLDERREEVWFTNDDEGESSDLYEEFMLDWDVWTRMGKPHQITVSVVPGDRLNDPGDLET